MLIQRITKRVENDDVVAIHQLACMHSLGQHGLQRDMKKALDLYLKAGKLGYCYSYSAIADLYIQGNGVPKERKKAIFYYEQAALGGHEVARHNLGLYEMIGAISGKPNMERAVKHWMISASSGLDESVTKIRESYQKGHATKKILSRLCLLIKR
jgi:TPR repeat protein